MTTPANPPDQKLTRENRKHSLHIDPRHANAWHNIGVAYSFCGNETAALDAIRKLRHLDPKKADKLFNLIKPHTDLIENGSEE